MKFTILEDRQNIYGLPMSVIEKLRALGLTHSSNNEKIEFCGVVILGEGVFVFTPRNSVTTINSLGLEAPKVASLILRSLHKYNTSAANAYKGGEMGDEMQGLGILSSILWLLNDYSSHGLHTTSQKIREINTGKINWNRTIVKETPHINAKGSPIYLKLHSDRMKYGSLSPVTLIHADAIKELDKNFCWVLSGDENLRLARDIDHLPASNLSLEMKLYELKKELRSAYADRDMLLIKALINYVESKHTGTTGDYLIGVRGFQNLWEEMLRRTLPGVMAVNQYLPKPAMIYKDSSKPALAKGMVTDIVIKKDNVLSVIDAKYYRAEKVGDSPGWMDIVKQLYYAHALQTKFPDALIVNWFAFPGNYNSICNGPLSKVLVIDPESEIILSDIYPAIGCSYFCPIEVMKKYSSSRKYDFSTIDAITHQVALQ